MSKDSQHYVPQGYLRKFTIEGEKSLVWEYDKATEKIANAPKSIRQICTKYQYYIQEDEYGNLDKERMENGFAKFVEDPGIRAIDAIPDMPKTNFSLNGDQKGALAFFIAILATRGPAFRDGVKKINEILVQKVGKPIIEKSIKTGECPQILQEELEKKDIWEVLKVDVKNWVSLKPMIEIAIVGARVILQKTWNFLRPDDGNFFVTSDNPFIFIPPFAHNGPYQIGPFHPMNRILVPLRKNLALIATNPSTKEQYEFLVKRASKKQNYEINDNIIAGALRYIYAPVKSRNLLKRVVKFKSRFQRLNVA